MSEKNQSTALSAQPQIMTLSGIYLDPREIITGQLQMVDLVKGLALTCRYQGQIPSFYSVAEHSVLTARLAEHEGDTEAILPALLHDAHEYLTGDVPSPIKQMVVGWRCFEDRVMWRVRELLGLPNPDDPVWARVHRYDSDMFFRESWVLRGLHKDRQRHIPEEIAPRPLDWPEAEMLLAEALRSFDIEPITATY